MATNLLKVSDGFTKLLPTVGSLALYAISFYFVSIVFRTLCGLGLRHLVGRWHCFDGHCGVFFGQKIDTAGLIGMALIISGVLVINLFFKQGINPPNEMWFFTNFIFLQNKIPRSPAIRN